MEEHRVLIFQREIVLGKRDFDQLAPLLEAAELQEWHLTSNEVDMLNYMLYFVIFVREKLQHPTFEQHVRTKLSQLYLENNMQIRIAELSRAASAALHVDLSECIHILYYLVYGRFASVAYVNMIAQNRQQKPTLKKIASSITSSFAPLTVESPHAIKMRGSHLDNRISWNFGACSLQTEVENFSHDLQEILKPKKTYLRLDLPQAQQPSSIDRSESNSLGVKLCRVKNRQTSPLMNILCNKTHTNLSSLRVNRRILNYVQPCFSQTLINASKRERQPIPSLEKPQKEKISLKTVLNIRQKLKSENAFLDELRKSLMSESCTTPLRKRHQYPEYRYQSSSGRTLKEIQNTASSTPHEEKAKQSITEQQCTHADPKVNNEEGNPDLQTIQDFRPLEESNDSPSNEAYKLLAENQKQPFRLRLTFYKKKFKEFVRGQQQRSSMLM